MEPENDKQSVFIAGLAVFLSATLLIVMIRVAADATGGQLLGHYRYPVAPQKSLVALATPGSQGQPVIKLRKAAARAYTKMSKAAKAQGVDFYPISGFRDLKDQQYYFFTLKSKENVDTLTRAHLCAPPGYSEHHTGYSIDIGDSARRGTERESSFTQTKSYQWLKRNAARFHFELSFPVGNSQRLAFEPWHWRYVGDMRSFRIFYRSKSGVTYASMFLVP